MDINEYKFLRKSNKNKNSNDKKIKKLIFILLNQILIVSILLLVTLIVIKVNPDYKLKVYKALYNTNLNFTGVKNIYDKYLGGVFPIKALEEEKPVFSEKITYKEASVYNNGVKLEVTSNYLVPVLESGIVVFIGDKEDYGKTIIVQQVNGIDVWYSNVIVKNIKMYDYLEKGSLLGEAINNEIYLVFQKEGVFLNYKDYIG